MQIPISSQSEYDKAVKKRLHMGNELVIQNTGSFIVVKTDATVGKNGRCKTDGKSQVSITAKENGIVTAGGKTTVIGHGNANIIARGNCKITLHGDAFVNCYGHCHVTLNGKSKASVDGSCTVRAFEESSVSASGSSKVYTEQKASARGTDAASLSGKGESTLSGYKNCTITAKDNCIVYANDNCTVQAADNCLVVARQSAKVVSQDNCLIMSSGNPDISIAGQCEHVDMDNVSDKNIMGTLKQMAQSRAIAERPYAAIQILKDNIPAQRKDAVSRRLAAMGLKDQTAAKNYLYSLIEAKPAAKSHNAAQNFERQLELAQKAGHVQGVCESAAAIGNEQSIGKKLLSEMNVTRDMAKKYASPEIYKTLEKDIFSRKPEQAHSRKM